MDRSLYVLATQQAWSIFLSQDSKIAPEDELRCTLERFVHGRWQAGETDLHELTCLGVSFLSRLHVPLEFR
jgi:hypothetical protein